MHPLDIINKLDSTLFDHVEKTRAMALEDGALSKKHKLLIALALDAAHGAAAGVKTLAVMAQKSGATKEEILEAVRVADYIAGVGSVYTAANAFQDLF
ncbi:MAG: carboxymuconolactone decarboxylase family protein [Spirochaetales bacterium]|nr:MAG: carboxymuconolactone decarboxylase family protein [Spirochaetales bacterium]